MASHWRSAWNETEVRADQGIEVMRKPSNQCVSFYVNWSYLSSGRVDGK